MTQMIVNVLSAAADDSSALVEFIMDGLNVGTEIVPALALAVLTASWEDPGDMVGMSFEREVE